jgi:hypothetical protein
VICLACGPSKPDEPPAGDRVATARGADCAHDDDCALVPDVTCCGECRAAPPYEAGTRASIDAIFIELETKCALQREDCQPRACDPVPAGCYARAACVDGRCVAETEGCGR